MPRPLGTPKEAHGKDWVALTLAVGLVLAVNFITIAVLWDAIASSGPGLSENATQILVSVFGGIIGVLGAYLGYRAGEWNARQNAGGDSSAESPPGPPDSYTGGGTQ